MDRTDAVGLSDASFAVQLLGGFAVRVDKECLSIPSRKEQWLLAKLLLAEGRQVRRQELLDDLWPQSIAADATYNLRRSLSRLRKALGTHAYRLQTPGQDTLRFQMQGVLVDALAFEQQTQHQQALALYTGPLLPDCDQVWILAERQRRHLLFQERTLRLAQEALRGGDPDQALAPLLRALALDPLWEQGRRLLMQVYAARGEPHQALLLYQELLRLLGRMDPRLVPDPETSALSRQIREQACQRVSPPAGEASHTPRHNLPCPATRFIGREQEICRVEELLGGTRLLTLTGAGGCGKTRLALAAASRLSASFPDGVFWVELAPLGEASRVASSVRAALGVQEVAAQETLETLVRALERRRLLLVLDNCEHVAQGVGALAGALLSGCPGVQILATSRAGLLVYGESLYRVPSLSLPPPGGCSVEGLWGFESTQLFVERAQASKPDLRLEEERAPVVASICRHLEGIPLAIELAAARVRSLSLEELERRLGDRFALLTGGARGAPSRHQTLRALMDWSYRLLSEAEQALFVRLSVFSGGWTLSAAERICVGGLVAEGSVLDLLSSLADQSLVEVVDAEAATRYRFLETVRQYAAEKLAESGEKESLQRRHRDYYLQWAESIGHWRDRPSNVLNIGRELDNIRSALHYSRSASQGTDAEWRLVSCLAYYCGTCGYYLEAVDMVEKALAHPPSAPSAIWWDLCLLYQDIVWTEEAGRVVEEECLPGYRQLGDRVGEMLALGALGNHYSRRDHWETAALHSEQALAICRDLGSPWLPALLAARGNFISRLGSYDIDKQHHARALELYEESYALDLKRGSQYGYARFSRGLAALTLGRTDYAESIFRECLPLYAKGMKTYVPALLHGFSKVAIAKEQWERAARLRGATESGVLAIHGMTIAQYNFYHDPRDVQRMIEALGKEAYEQAFMVGYAMPIEQTIVYALEESEVNKTAD